MKVCIRLITGLSAITMLLLAGAVTFFIINPVPDEVTSAEEAYRQESLGQHRFAWTYLNGNRTTDLMIPVFMGATTDGTEHLRPSLLDVPVLKGAKIDRFQSLTNQKACTVGGCAMTTKLGMNRICQIAAREIKRGNVVMNERFVLLHELEHCRLDQMAISAPEIGELFHVEGNERMTTNLKESYADLASLLTFRDESLIRAIIKARKYWLKNFGDVEHYTNWVLQRALDEYSATGTWPSNPVTYSLNQIRDYRIHIESGQLASFFER